MKKITTCTFYLFFCFAIIFTHCRSDTSNASTKVKTEKDTGNPTPTKILDDYDEDVVTIFYNLPTPVEMTSLMKTTNAAYYPDLLNSVENNEKYTTNSGLALNLGIYGVDLAYAKIFKQVQESINYLTAIKKLTGKLGIPDQQSTPIFELLESSSDDRDKLIDILSETYENADKFLRENDRESTAALVFLGGWIEGLYIATKMYDRNRDNNSILNRIILQKYSLKTVMALLSKHAKNEAIEELMPMIVLLKNMYDDVNISYNNNAITIDTIKKIMIINDDNPVSIEDKDMDDIISQVNRLRARIVEYY